MTKTVFEYVAVDHESEDIVAEGRVIALNLEKATLTIVSKFAEELRDKVINDEVKLYVRPF